MNDYFHNWDSESDNPSKPGIYAILYCWDAQEGIFDGVGIWDGETWDHSLPMSVFSKESFDSVESAKEWADKNNPEHI